MTRRTPVALLGLLVPAVFASCARLHSAAPRAADVEHPASADSVITAFVEALDDARQAAGCHGRLRWDEDVASVARAHALDMQENGYFAHHDTLGHDVGDRLEQARIPVSGAAENLALGRMTGREAYESWRGSPDHERNMMNCRYTRHGVAIVGDYWVHVLLSPPDPFVLPSAGRAVTLEP